MARTTPFYSFMEMMEIITEAETQKELEGYALFILEEASTYFPAEVYALLNAYRIQSLSLLLKKK